MKHRDAVIGSLVVVYFPFIISSCGFIRERRFCKMLPIKLVMVGESSVGKSTIVRQFILGKFEDSREPTIGAAVFKKTISLDDDTSIKLEIWDTAGQERNSIAQLKISIAFQLSFASTTGCPTVLAKLN